MKRLIRRSRRSIEKANNLFSNLLSRTREKQGYKTLESSSLSLEPLESRVLLTTLVLPKGEQGEFVYRYADPEHGDDGTNEIRIGTLSGQGPEQDVIVEILGIDTAGNPVGIGGTYTAPDGTTGDYDGGLNDGQIIDPIANSGLDIHATATDSVGNTFGITTDGDLYRLDTAGDFSSTFIGNVVDTNNPFATAITFAGFESADFAWAEVDVDTNNDGFFDTTVYKEVIYAVVQAPLVDDNGLVIDSGSVLITIDPLTGEAEPVAKIDGTSSYAASAIASYSTDEDSGEDIPVNITSIVFSEEGHNDSNATDEPVFIAYDSGTHRFLTLGVDVSQFTGDQVLDVNTFTTYDDDRDNEIWVTGLAYCDYDNDGDTDLFATQYKVNDNAEQSDGKLVIVNFGNVIPGLQTGLNYTDVTEMGVHDEIPDDPPDRYLESLTYNPVMQAAYSTETFGGLNTYEIILDGLIQTENGFETYSADIFQMYVRQSTPDVYITITYIDNDGVYQPQGGTTTYLYTDEDLSEITSPDNAGGVAIGTNPVYHDQEIWFDGETFFTDPEITAAAPSENYPGVWENGEMRPGIIVEEGNDVGMMSIGGSVFGDIVVRDGSIGTFYAGFLGVNQFVVNGDLQNLAVGTQAGGINESDESWQSALNELYFSSNQGGLQETSTALLDVYGQLGSFHSNGDWGLPIRVRGYDDVASFPGVFDSRSDDPATENPDISYVNVYRELERKSGNELNVDFYSGSLDYIITNDTATSAQFLGTTSEGLINVVGQCESVVYDPEDYYGFGALAGQEIEISIYYTGGVFSDTTGIPVAAGSETPLPGAGVVTVYDPNGEFIAASGEVDVTSDPANPNYLPISFTADFAGAYTVLVQSGGYSYRLQIDGVSETVVGGGTVLEDIRSSGYASSSIGADTRPSVQTLNGNIGVINVVGSIHIGQFQANDGDIIAIRTLSTETVLDGQQGFVDEIDDNGGVYFEEAYVIAEGTIGEVRSYGSSYVEIYAGKDVQSVYCYADFAGGIYADDNIGSIYTGGNYGGITDGDVTNLYDSWVIANADGEGPGGVIDSVIILGNNYGDFSTGRSIDGDVTSGSGNLRYVYIAGSGVAYWEADPSETVRITDDSGAKVIITPGYVTEDTEEVTVVEVDGEEQEIVDIVNNGGVITYGLIPVFAILPGEINTLAPGDYPGAGNAIVALASTNGIRITSDGAGPVEIGLVQVQGAEDNSVIISGDAPISIFRLEAENPVAAEDADTQDNEDDEENDIEVIGINSIINNSGWWLDEDGIPYQKGYSDTKTTWVGGDMVSVVVGEVTLAEVEVADDTGLVDNDLTDEEIDAILNPIYDLSEVSIKGNLGYSQSTTGQYIVAPLVYQATDQAVTAGGSMYNGLYSQASVEDIRVAGRFDGNMYVAGSVYDIKLNSDNSDFENQFDGVSGTIIVRGNLEHINVGDGLLAPGTGAWAQAGIFASNDIGSVVAKGYDHNIAGAIIANGSIGKVSISDGADLVGYNYTGSWNCPNIGAHIGFQYFGMLNGVTDYYGFTFGEYALNELSIKGEDSEMIGAYISVSNINRVTVNGGAEGIRNSLIETFVYGTTESGLINQINVGGYGIIDSAIDAGYDIRKISIDKGGVIDGTIISSDYQIGSIIADAIIDTTIMGGVNNINEIKKIEARDYIQGLTLNAGELDKLIVKNDLTGSSIWVEGDLGLIKTGGDMVSNIVVGGNYGYLKKMIVGGDLGTLAGGNITVEGIIGTIKVKGDFEADLYVNQSHQYRDENNIGFAGDDIKSIDVGGIFDIEGNIYGDIGSLKGKGDLGKIGDELNVYGSIKKLQLSGNDKHYDPNDGPNDIVDSGSRILTDINVTGNIGSIKTTGDIIGDISVDGDLKKIQINRSDKITGETHGLIGNVTVGQKLGSVTVKNGDINLDNIQAETTGKIKTVGCDLYGNVITNGGAGLDLTGSLDGFYISTGDVDQIVLSSAKGTNEDCSLTEGSAILIDGDLDKLIIEDNIYGIIYVTGNIGSIEARQIGSSDISTTIIAGGNIGKIDVEFMFNSVIVAGFDPGAGGTINPDDFAKIDGQGADDVWELDDFQGQVWADANWQNLDYTSDAIQAEIATAYEAYLMTKFTIEGDVVDTREVATSGNIDKVEVETLNYSSIVAGVSPGSDGLYGDLNGTDKAGNGYSVIGKVSIGSTNGLPEANGYLPFGVFADGEIKKLVVGGTTYNIPAQPLGNNYFRAWEIVDIDEFDLTAEPGTQLLSFEAGDSLEYPIGDGSVIFKLSGNGQGAVKIDTATNEILAIQLKDTDSRTSVSVQTKNLDDEIQIGRIFTGDDGSLKSLIVDGTLVYSEDGSSLNIGGNVGKIQFNGIDSTIDGIDAAMTLSVGGSLGSLIIGDITADSDNAIDLNIQGSVSKMSFNSVSTYASIAVDSARTIQVDDDFEGTITSQNDVSKIQVKGDYDGLIIVDGDIQKVDLKGDMGKQRSSGRPEATVSASGFIKSFSAASMENASIVAGEDIYSVKINGDVTRSDIVSGVIMLDVDDLRGSTVEVNQGDIVKVFIKGDFLESNIVAGVAPGDDGQFSTSDDILNSKASESNSAPQVESVSMETDGGGTGFTTLRIKFVDSHQGVSSNIDNVKIKGSVLENQWDSYAYAIMAAGDVDYISVHGERFSGDENISLKEVSVKTLNSDLIDKDVLTLSDVAQSAVWLQVDGIDQQFAPTEQIFQQGTTDDTFVYGAGVSIRYEEATNSIVFIDASGLLENQDGANYYKLILNDSLIRNKMDVELDGEYTGEMPSGDSLPGGDFVYTFAVGDTGDLSTTPFRPFDANQKFPVNYYWSYEDGEIGDNRSLEGGISTLDNDFYAFSGLEKGQILTVQLTDMNMYNDAWYYVADWVDNIIIELQKVEEHPDYNDLEESSTVAYNEYALGLSDAPTVASEMSEIFYSGDSFYGYDDEGGNFFKISVDSPDGTDGQSVTTFDVLANDIIDVNSTIRSTGIIESIYALAGHSGDTFWAIADYVPAAASSYHALVQIQNIERDVEVDQSESLNVIIADSDVDLESYGIIGLVEDRDYRNGQVVDILYGITADGTLYELNSDIYDDDFGSIVENHGQIVDVNGQAITDFNITGISMSREGDGFLVLHDLPKGDYTTIRTDSIYKVEFNEDGLPQAEYWMTPDPADEGLYDFAGIAASPDGYVLVGMPSYGTPKGDNFTITYANETATHEFGGDDVTSLQAGLLSLYSDVDTHPENKETFSFVQNDLYYGFTIEYNSALTGQLQVEVDDIDFWEVVDGQTMLAGSIVDFAYSDNPFVDVTVVNQPDIYGNVSSSLIIDIDATFARGEANIYFSADSGEVWTMSQFSMDKVGELQGENTRDAISSSTSTLAEHDMIMPGITELTVSPVTIETTIRLNADDILDFNLRKYLSNYLYSQLSGELDQTTINEILNDLIDRGQEELAGEFLASLEFTNYNALAYDADQEVFALVSTDTYAAKPIMVADPITPEKGDIELTLDALSDIYSKFNLVGDGETDLTITAIKGLEFGEVKSIAADDGSSELVDRAELWAIIEVTAVYDPIGGGPVEMVSTDHLVKFEDILNPSDNLMTSDWTMGAFGLGNVSELAFGSFPEAQFVGQAPVLSEDKNELFGLDTETNTLVRFDINTEVVNIDSPDHEVIVNVNFGRPETIGSIDSSYNITSMDFDSNTRLLAVENGGADEEGQKSIIQISTALNAGTDRTQTIELLEDGDYSVLTFDSTLDGSAPILIRQVEGSPELDADNMYVKLGNGDWQEHQFGQDATDLGTVVVSSVGNTTMEHGYYKLDIDYTRGQGDITITLDGIDWSGRGDIDSVKINDTANATVLDYDDNTITLSIDTDNGSGSLDLFFGSTVDILRPGLGYTTTTTVEVELTADPNSGTFELSTVIEEDGDYVLRVGPAIDTSSQLLAALGANMVASKTINYGLTVYAFNDGDSDFGISVTDSGFIYDSAAPNDSAVDLTSDSLGTEWVPDPRRYDEDGDDNLYIFNRDDIAGSTDWTMRAEGELLSAGEAGQITVTSELAILQDVDIYKVQLSEGQKMEVDLDAIKYTGGQDVELLVGVYNSDLESVATIYTDSTDTATPAEMVDPHYVMQAINTLPIDGYENNPDYILDPMTLQDHDNDPDTPDVLVGTYYIVVSIIDNGISDGHVDTNDYGSINPYTLTITTSDGGEEIETYGDEGPQLVYLSYGDKITGENLTVDFLKDSLVGYADIAERAAFSLDDFEDLPEYFYDDVDDDGLADDRVDVTWDYMVARMVAKVEQVYRDALDDPSTPDVREDLQLIQFVTDIDIHQDFDGDGEDDYPESAVLCVDDFNINRMEHSTVVIGGTYPESGLMGIAQTVDRNNQERDDYATAGSANIGALFNRFLDGTDKENVDMAVTVLAGTTIHELGHILGLEHSTEVNPDLTYPIESAAVYEPDNVMNYNDISIRLSGAKFEERNKMADVDYYSYSVPQPGYQNEIDSLLRNLGTKPPTMS